MIFYFKMERDNDLKFCTSIKISWVNLQENLQAHVILLSSVVSFFLNFEKAKLIKFCLNGKICFLFQNETSYPFKIDKQTFTNLSDTCKQRGEFFSQFKKSQSNKIFVKRNNNYFYFEMERKKI